MLRLCRVIYNHDIYMDKSSVSDVMVVEYLCVLLSCVIGIDLVCFPGVSSVLVASVSQYFCHPTLLSVQFLVFFLCFWLSICTWPWVFLYLNNVDVLAGIVGSSSRRPTVKVFKGLSICSVVWFPVIVVWGKCKKRKFHLVLVLVLVFEDSTSTKISLTSVTYNTIKSLLNSSDWNTIRWKC